MSSRSETPEGGVTPSCRLWRGCRLRRREAAAPGASRSQAVAGTGWATWGTAARRTGRNL